MILASAQTKPKRFDIESNLIDHYNLIDLASENGADLILFPEMSITGYERDKALTLAFTPEDFRLNMLRKMSADRQIIIIAGAPILSKNGLYIGAFILKPDNSISIYTKQFLHEGEEKYFKSSFDYNPVIRLDKEQFSLAICADIDNQLHAENASKVKTTIYLTSIFFTINGIPDAYKKLSECANKFKMNVLMSNFSGRSWGLDSGGKSGFWNESGNLVANLNDSDSGLLLVGNFDNEWIAKTVKY